MSKRESDLRLLRQALNKANRKQERSIKVHASVFDTVTELQDLIDEDHLQALRNIDPQFQETHPMCVNLQVDQVGKIFKSIDE